MDDGMLSPPSPSLQRKLKSSFCCFIGHHYSHESLDSATAAAIGRPRLLHSPSSSCQWHKSSGSPPGHLGRHRCRNLIYRLGHRHSHSGGHGRHHISGDFTYDPLSYALNFDDGSPEDDWPVRNFSAALPASPPPFTNVAVARR